MNFEPLCETHIDLLLRFETENRDWFESLITPRGSEFYSRSGVENHVQTLIAARAASNSAAFVVTRGGQIIGRANLKEIGQSTRSAEVGYRVSDSHTGKGVASYCVAELVREAVSTFDLKRLTARVLHNNPASQRVLEKHSFLAVSIAKDYYQLNGTTYDCTFFERRL